MSRTAHRRQDDRGPTELLAEFITGTTLDTVPERKIRLAELAILDTIGVSLAGSQERAGRSVVGYVRTLGGNAQSSIIGAGHMTSAPLAALANGTLAHAMDYDDMHTGAAGHPSAVVVPAALAVAERRGSSGTELLEAFIVGFETIHRLGRAMGMTALERGFHPTGIWAAIGAAATAAKLERLTVDQTRMALGIAGSHAAGILANFGTMVKPLHAGHGAMSGVLAVGLVAHGFTASDCIIESANGFLEVFGGEVGDGLTDGLGTEFFTEDGYGLKLYPACGKTHATIDAALHLRETHRLADQSIHSITITTDPAVRTVLPFDNPTTPLEAKFSLPYCAAVALLDGAAGPAQFTDARVGAADVRALVARVEIVDRGGEGWGGFLSAETVQVCFGASRSMASFSVDRAHGDLAVPMGRTQAVAKFVACAATTLSDEYIHVALGLWETLREIDDVSDLCRAVGSPREDLAFTSSAG